TPRAGSRCPGRPAGTPPRPRPSASPPQYRGAVSRIRGSAPLAPERGLEPHARPIAEQDSADAGEHGGNDDLKVGECHVDLLSPGSGPGWVGGGTAGGRRAPGRVVRRTRRVGP